MNVNKLDPFPCLADHHAVIEYFNIIDILSCTQTICSHSLTHSLTEVHQTSHGQQRSSTHRSSHYSFPHRGLASHLADKTLTQHSSARHTQPYTHPEDPEQRLPSTNTPNTDTTTNIKTFTGVPSLLLGSGVHSETKTLIQRSFMT